MSASELLGLRKAVEFLRADLAASLVIRAELLEALRKLLPFVEYAMGELGETDDAEAEIRAARAAIAKAEGK